MLLALVAVGSYAVSVSGDGALPRVFAAWLLCTSSALAAQILAAQFASTPYALPVHLGTMLIRMGVPLVGLLVLPRFFPTLAGPGLIYALIPFYAVGLVAETLLSMRHISPAPLAAMSGKTLKA
jgi:hypothetical protein